MSEALLGCPHCNKPVGFAQSMAGQVVACPHCQGPFQMPDRPPSVPEKPRAAPRSAEPELQFEEDRKPGAPATTVRAELDSYRAAATLATVFALLGSAGVLVGLVVAIVTIIVPHWRGESGAFLASAQGFLWLLVAFLFAALGFVALFMIRAAVLVGVDAARTLRALERDAAASEKTK
jgi:hypothetical protein